MPIKNRLAEMQEEITAWRRDFHENPELLYEVHRTAARVAEAAGAAGVLRVKGFAEVTGKPMRLQVQAVGPRVVQHYDRPWAVGEARGARLVVIGLKGLDRDQVSRILAA